MDETDIQFTFCNCPRICYDFFGIILHQGKSQFNTFGITVQCTIHITVSDLIYRRLYPEH